jgi:hypothetical protein
MCNGYRHAEGCECGFGPPYPTVDVRVRNMLKRGDRQSSKVTELDLTFHIPKANFFHLVDKAGKDRVLKTAVGALQHLADNRFGKGNIKVVSTKIEKGTIGVWVVLLAVMGSVYEFFKNYESVRNGVMAFVRDIKNASSRLNRVVRRRYLREEQRSLTKASQDQKKKEQVRNEE